MSLVIAILTMLKARLDKRLAESPDYKPRIVNTHATSVPQNPTVTTINLQTYLTNESNSNNNNTNNTSSSDSSTSISSSNYNSTSCNNNNTNK